MTSDSGTEPEYEVPGLTQQTATKDSKIELTDCPAYGIIST